MNEPKAYGTKVASVKEVTEAAKRWSDGVLKCRTYGHNWQPSRAIHNRKMHFIYVERICLECLPPGGGQPTTKHEELSERGTVLASWYTYADGYLTQGHGRIVGEAKDELRITTVERTFKVQRDQTQKPRSSMTKQFIGSDNPGKEAS